jgi:hypothetical protein
MTEVSICVGVLQLLQDVCHFGGFGKPMIQKEY